MTTKVSLPKTAYIYHCDTVDGVPLFAVVASADEIPEEDDGVKVGVYTLTHTKTFRCNKRID